MADSWLASCRAVGRELTRGLVRLLYPGLCQACGQPLPEDQEDFCAACRAALLSDPRPACPRCADTMGPFAYWKDGCSRCRHQRFHFEAALRLGPYVGLLMEVIVRMKKVSGEGLAETMGAVWAAHLESRLRDLKGDVVVPIPRHWWRRLLRGYDQTEALARPPAARLGLPCRPGWLRRVRYAPQQSQPTVAARRENVRNAFTARPRPELAGKTILLVDDVLTTGSTANDAARALRAAGAARVVVAVLARRETEPASVFANH